MGYGNTCLKTVTVFIGLLNNGGSSRLHSTDILCNTINDVTIFTLHRYLFSTCI
jgi:hypothetical protein